ncbi:hypothetical protein H8E50_09020 [bacterium]|nr:hypothetical protein [bacterium]
MMAGFITVLLSLTHVSANAFLYKGIELKVQTELTETYDDNLNFSKDDKKQDVTSKLSATLSAKMEGKRRTMEVRGSVAEGINAKYSDIKTSSHNINARFSNHFSETDGVTLTYNAGVSHSPASFDEEFGRVTTRRETSVQRFNASYLKEIGEHLRLTGIYAYSSNRFTERALQGSSSTTIGINGSYNYSSAVTLTFNSQYLKSSTGASTTTNRVGFRRFITKSLYFDGSAGVAVNSLPSGGSDGRSISYDVSMVNEVDERTVVLMKFSTSERFADESGNLFKNWRITGELRRQMWEKLNGNLTGFYGEGEFKSIAVTDILLGIDTSISYEFNENWSGSISYSFSDLNSTFDFRNYTRSTASLKVMNIF